MWQLECVPSVSKQADTVNVYANPLRTYGEGPFTKGGPLLSIGPKISSEEYGKSEYVDETLHAVWLNYFKDAYRYYQGGHLSSADQSQVLWQVDQRMSEDLSVRLRGSQQMKFSYGDVGSFYDRVPDTGPLYSSLSCYRSTSTECNLYNRIPSEMDFMSQSPSLQTQVILLSEQAIFKISSAIAQASSQTASSGYVEAIGRQKASTLYCVKLAS